MTELSDIQSVFQDYLFTGCKTVNKHIVGSKKISAKQRLEIYKNAYRYRLLDALIDDHSVLHTLLGDDEFYQMGCLYIDAYPSKHASIRWFGKYLEKFLFATEPYASEPALSEIAKFEWSLITAFDSQNCNPITVEAMSEIPPQDWELLRFSFTPSLQCIQLQWNVVKIWNAIKAGNKPPLLEKFDLPQTWLVWRKELETQFRSLAVEEAWAIQVLSNGETFGTVCHGLCEWMDEQHVGLYAAGLLKNWITQEIVSQINPD